MKKLYLLFIVFGLLPQSNKLLAQRCSVSISTNTTTTELNCTNTTLRLQANTVGKGLIHYQWYKGGDTLRNDTLFTITVSDSALYTVDMTDAFKCTSSSSVNITKDITTPAITILSFPDSAICSGDSAILIALGANTYIWEPGSIEGSVNIVKPSETTGYTVTGTALNGCSASKSFIETVNPLPTASISGTTSVCQNAVQPLITFAGESGTQPFTFSYNINEGSTQTITTSGNDTAATITTPTAATGVFDYKLLSVSDAFGCTQPQGDTATVTVLPVAALASLKTASICDSSTFEYTITSSVVKTSFSWTRPAVEGITNPLNQDTTNIINEILDNTTDMPVAVTYYVQLSTGIGCETKDSIKLTVNPTPQTDAIPDYTFCNGKLAVINAFSSSSPNASFTWSNDDTAIGLAANGSGNILPFIAKNNSANAITGHITVDITASSDNCKGDSSGFNITVLPAPVLTSRKDTSICSNNAFQYTAKSSSAGVTFNWKRPVVDGIANPESSGDSTIDETLINKTTQPIAVKYIFTLSSAIDTACGTTDTVKVTVNPTPETDAIPDYTFCNGNLAIIKTFSSSSPNASFTWSNDDTAMGLAAGGSGNILPFIAKNNSTDTLTATITVVITASSDSCPGINKTFTIKVLPAPVLTSSKTASICDSTEFIYTAASSAANTTFSWRRPAVEGISNTSNSGSTNIITETLDDTTGIPVVVTYYIKLSTGTGCDTEDSIKLTVNPTPNTDAISDYTFCNGELAKVNVFSSSSPNASFTWSNDNTAIGLAASGTGNILPFFATDTISNDAITGHITVAITASSDNCPGSNTTFSITVLPAPFLISSKIASICDNTEFIDTARSSAANTTFSWTRPFVEGIKNEAGNGADSTIKETLDNTTDNAVTVNYIFSLSIEDGCKKYDTLRVTVYPTPVITKIDFDTAYCNQQDVTNGIKFITPTQEPLLTWKLAPLVSVGLPANGTGDIPPFRASNVGSEPIEANINVSISVNNQSCSGGDSSFSFKVLPTPRLTSATDTSVCDKTFFEYTPISSAQPASFSWTRSYDENYITVVMNSEDSIKDVLYNNDTLPHAVNYTISLSTGEGAGCKTDSIVTVTVNPTPDIHSVDDYTFCNSDLVSAISFSSSSPDPTFTWSNDNNKIGLGGAGIGDITGFIATNNNANLDSALVKVTVKASSDNCPGTDTALFKIYVLPTPYLTSRMTASVCDNNLFVDTAKSYAPATSFSWVRLPAAHISPDAGTDTTYSNVISETLHSDTSQPVIVQYDYMLSTDSGFILSPGAGEGCTTTESLLLTVNPTPVIDDIPNYTFCNSTRIPKDSISFHSASPDSSFSWTCDKSIGFGLSGIGNIPAFTAANSSDDTIIATITVSITAGSDKCSGPAKTFTITVNPSAAKPYFTSLMPYNDTLKLCNGTNNISFNVNTPINGTDYRWASSELDTNIVHIKNAETSNTVISFLDAGTYSIKAKAINSAHGGCTEAIYQVVIVSNTEGIAERNIFKKQPGNLLIYPDNSLNRLNGYQWGYDSVISFSDKIFGRPTGIPGQVYQFFTPGKKFLNGDALNETNYLYWVSLRKGDSCYSKVYYNGPYVGDNIQVVPNSDSLRLVVIPNPNNGVFEIILSGNIYGDIRAKIYNTVGQLVYTKSFSKLTQSVNEKFVTGNLASGLYYIELYGSDLNKAVSRFLIQH